MGSERANTARRLIDMLTRGSVRPQRRINVLANLVAAAAIYLTGVWYGVITNESLLDAALLVITLFVEVPAAIYWSRWILRRTRGHRLIVAILIVQSVFLALLAVTSLVITAVGLMQQIWVWSMTVPVAVATAGGYTWAWRRYQAERRAALKADGDVGEWVPDPRAYL